VPPEEAGAAIGQSLLRVLGQRYGQSAVIQGLKLGNSSSSRSDVGDALHRWMLPQTVGDVSHGSMGTTSNTSNHGISDTSHMGCVLIHGIDGTHQHQHYPRGLMY
jgi:hypothetical protein